MDTAFNLLVIAFIALIAYWWANQGLLSSILHFACVLCAGVLAFAGWEPVAEILLGQKWAQPYAFGVALLGPFALYLLVLRVAADKLAPDNLNFPHAVNLTLGGAVGAASGVLTVGISLIGVGHLHSSREILGVAGASRQTDTRGQPNVNVQGLWLPAHLWTASTFAWLSEGSMSPSLSNATLATMQPKLGQQALGLFRDTYERSGRIARTVAAPDSIKITGVALVSDYQSEGLQSSFPAYIVGVRLEPGATTEGQGFAISASQMRLIGASAGLSTPVAYPVGWWQPNAVGAWNFRLFDDVKNFISNETAGTTNLDIALIYRADAAGSNPRFLHAMGQRLPLGKIEQTTLLVARKLLGGSGAAVTVPNDLPPVGADDLAINDSVMPASIDLNNLGGTMTTAPDTNLLFTGEGYYQSGGFMGNKGVIVKGIWSPPKTRVMRLNLSRGSNSLDFWNDRSKLREEAGENAQLALVDDLGQTYFPIGYIWAEKSGQKTVTIKLQREGTYYTIGSFPSQASKTKDTLHALFTPAVGRTIVGIRLGEKWVARAKVVVPAPN